LRVIFGEILSLFHGDFEQQIRSTSLPSSFIIIYCKYYIAYCNKMILEECDMKENEEEPEAVTTPYFKRQKQ
jgi:hypothetical protein